MGANHEGARPVLRTIALDGPAAAGKSTVGRRLAGALGFLFLDTGALYRALTVCAVDEGIPAADGKALAASAQEAAIAVVARAGSEAGYAVTVHGRDVTDRLWEPDVDAAVAEVSRHPEVRAILIAPQRQVADLGPVVMVGRDIGTVVMPDADLKIYLDASAPERARRRFRERIAKGDPAAYRDVLRGIEARDASDAGRQHAPLARARDAVVVSTDGCDIETVVAALCGLAGRWPDDLTRNGGHLDCTDFAAPPATEPR
jgi:cytidylate kinase